MALSVATRAALDACLDAAIDGSLWPDALQRLGESLGAQSCTLGTWNGGTDPFRMPRSVAHEPFAAIWLEREAQAPDPHIARGRRRALAGQRFILEQDLTTEAERRTLAYYGEIAARGDRHWWAAACFTEGARHWCLPLYRNAARGPFSPVEAMSAAEAAQHLSRVVRLAERLADDRLTVGLALLDRFRCAAILVDERGRPLRANAAADALLAGGLDLHGGRLLFDGGRSVIALAGPLAALRAGLPGDAGEGPLVLRQSGQPVLRVDIEPATGLAGAHFVAGVAILTLTPIVPAQRVTPQTLRALYGLTAAEAAVALRIAEGQGLKPVAAALGIGLETARSHLRAAFLKTGTHRQSGLASLIAGLGSLHD